MPDEFDDVITITNSLLNDIWLLWLRGLLGSN
jgi:hypothetical protein